MNYSKELKDALLRRMFPPNNESIGMVNDHLEDCKYRDC